MRVPHHLGRILVLLAMALGVNALCENVPITRDFAHVPRGEHRHFPSHRMHRLSSRGRRSQGWEAPEGSGPDHAQAQAPAAVARAPHATPAAGHAIDVSRAVPLFFYRLQREWNVVAWPVMAHGSRPGASEPVRGPPSPLHA